MHHSSFIIHHSSLRILPPLFFLFLPPARADARLHFPIGTQRVEFFGKQRFGLAVRVVIARVPAAVVVAVFYELRGVSGGRQVGKGKFLFGFVGDKAPFLPKTYLTPRFSP